MKSFRKYIIVTLTLVLTLSMSMTVYGDSGKKPVYLLTKVTGYNYDPSDQETVTDTSYTKNTYDKHGLLKSVRSSDSYGVSTKGSFVYNKKKQVIKQFVTDYIDGRKGEKHCYKYSYNKNGYIRRVRCYWIDRGRYELCSESRLTWNKKGQLTKITDMDDNGKIEQTTYYKYYKDGRLRKVYFKESPNVIECTYDGNTGKKVEYEDKSKKNIATVTLETYRDGHIVENTLYGEENADTKWSSGVYQYKEIKLSSKYRKLVRRQQAFDSYVGF